MTAVSTVHMYFRWTSHPTTTLRNAQGPPGEAHLHKDTASPLSAGPQGPWAGGGAWCRGQSEMGPKVNQSQRKGHTVWPVPTNGGLPQHNERPLTADWHLLKGKSLCLEVRPQGSLAHSSAWRNGWRPAVRGQKEPYAALRLTPIWERRKTVQNMGSGQQIILAPYVPSLPKKWTN